MKKVLLSLLLLVVAAATSKTFAQGPVLGFDTTQGLPNFPTSVVLGSTANFNLTIKNYGNTTYSGPISIERQIQDSTGGIVDTTTTTSTLQATVAQGTVFNFNYTDTFSLARHFFVGIDVVVIWPKAIGVPTHDSLSYSVHVLAPSAISKLLSENGIMIYPNPCRDQFKIENNSPLNPIEHVRIYKNNGQLILSKSRTEIIDLSEIPDELYMVELCYKSGMRKVMRVQKQN